MEEIQAKSQSHKIQTVRFWISECLVLPEQIESDYGLRFSLFRNFFLIFNLKSCVLLPI
jgi:hypothetical protein